MTNSGRVHSWADLRKRLQTIVANALSRLDKIDDLNNKVKPTLNGLSEIFGLNHEDVLHHIILKTIMIYQQKDKSKLKFRKNNLMTMPLNKFMGQVRRVLVSVDTVILWSQNNYKNPL